MLEDTISPAALLGTISALFPKLCHPSSLRETSATLTTISTLPSSCWTGTSSDTSARKLKASGDPCWNPLTALLVPPAQAGRQDVESPTKYINRLQWKNPIQFKGDCMNLQQTVYCLLCPTRAHEGSPPRGSLIQAVQLERRRCGH